MKIPKHPYILKFKKTKEIINLISDEDRVKKYLKELKVHSCEMYEHCIRTSLLCIDLGLENNFSLNDVKLVGYAGLLHDYGKVHISKEILEKQTALTEKEREKIKTHPRKTAENIHELGDRVKILIAGHHENQYEKYPRTGKDRRKNKRLGDRRKSLEQYKCLIQVVAVSDMYDSLRTKRAYKASKTREEAIDIIYGQFIGDEKYIKQISTR